MWDFVCNVVTAHVAQPHLRLPRTFGLSAGNKKGKRISTVTRSLLIPPHLQSITLSNLTSRRPSQNLSSQVVHHNPTPNGPPYYYPPTFFGCGFFASGMQHPQQVQFFPDGSLPPGQSDLEALERLKETIINNQHEIFRATPRPAALASLYRGALPSVVLPHPEQIPGSAKEKSASAPSSSLSFEKPSSSGAHVVSAVQGGPSIGSQSRAGASGGTVRCPGTLTSSSLTDL